jgi:alpha-L-fucosidase
VVTLKNKAVFIHILKKPEQKEYLFIPELKDKIVKGLLYGTTKEIKFKQQPEGTFIYLDSIEYNEIDTIIQLELK